MTGTRIPGEPAEGTPYDDGLDRDALGTANSTEGDSNFTTDGFDAHTVVGWDSNYTSCERSGFRLQEGEAVHNWDGLYTRPDSEDRKHPAEFARALPREHGRGSRRPEGPPSYLPVYNLNMVQFGGNANLTVANSFNFADADTDRFTISMWLKRRNLGTDALLTSEIGSNIFRLYFGSGDRLTIYALKALGGDLFSNEVVDVDINPDSGVINLLMSWAASGSGASRERHFEAYVGDTEIADITDAATADIYTSFGHSLANCQFGAGADGVGQSNLWVGDLWWDTNNFLDFSSADNRAKFHDSNGHPVDLGNNGDKPLGAQPQVFFGGKQRAKHWNAGTNKGSVTGFSMSGTVTDVHKSNLGR